MSDEHDDDNASEYTQEELNKLLSQERQVMDISLIEQTRRLLQEAAPQAAANIVNMANHAANENIKYNANKFLVEQILNPDSDAGKGILEDILGDMVKSAELIANGKDASGS